MIALVGVFEVDLVEPRQGRLEEFHGLEPVPGLLVEIAVSDVRAIADAGRGLGVFRVVASEGFAHFPHFLRERRRLGKAGHRLDGEPRDSVLLREVHELPHVRQITIRAARFVPHQIPRHRAGIRAHGLRSQHRADFNKALEIPPCHRLPFPVFLKKTAQLAVCGEQAVNRDPEIIGLLFQTVKIRIGQLIGFEKRAELQAGDPFLRHEAEQPGERIPVFDGVGFHPE